ncbi:MAG: cytochrome c biogenesis protein CcdA [Candidatus Omnitrophota bacterium]
MRKNFKIAIFLIPSFISLIFFLPLAAEVPQSKIPVLTEFCSANCHNCLRVKQEFLPSIENKFKGRIKIDSLDIGNIENYKLLLSLKSKYKIKIKNTMPVFFLEGNFLNGQGISQNSLTRFIEASLRNPKKEAGELPQVNLITYFRSFKPLVVLSAGLIDGINPCAFTVIVFFISFLSLQGYRKKELLFIGSTFIFAVFLTYILIGLGFFGFFYRLNSFWLISKIVNFIIGSFSIILGVLAIYDFLKFKKTKDTEGLILQLPKSIKNQIHRLVGLHYRKDKHKDEFSQGKAFFTLITSAFISGFLVSLLEAVCTGQTYLPTISFILKTSPLKLEAFGYLVSYNLMFILPLTVIFIFGLLGVTSEQFSRFLKSHLAAVKILMAGLFLSLGIFLIWRA